MKPTDLSDVVYYSIFPTIKQQVEFCDSIFPYVIQEQSTETIGLIEYLRKCLLYVEASP